MDRTQYWELIEQARDAVPDGDCDEKADAFVTALAAACIADRGTVQRGAIV